MGKKALRPNEYLTVPWRPLFLKPGEEVPQEHFGNVLLVKGEGTGIPGMKRVLSLNDIYNLFNSLFCYHGHSDDFSLLSPYYHSRNDDDDADDDDGDVI